MTAKAPRTSEVTAPVYVLAALAGGPFHGQRFKVKAGPVRLGLTTRAKRGPKDRPPVAYYSGIGASGRLGYVETIGNEKPKK